MTHPHHILRALAAAAAVTVLVAGPVSATESGGSGESPAATEAPAGEAGAEGGAEGEGAAEGEGEGEHGHTKIQPPLGFDEPKELVGWGFLALTGLAGLAAAYNGMKQLKGSRPQADGSWRPR